MIERQFDDETGIVTVSAHGALSADEVDRHADEFAGVVAALHARGSPVRVLYNVEGMQTPNCTLERRLFDAISRTIANDDRCVILTRDMVERTRLRRIASGRQLVVFASRLPAEMWLLLNNPHAILKQVG